MDLLPVKVDSVNISKSKLDLMEGEEATLTATVTPDNATNKTVTWESSDSSIATVVNGKVTAVRPGKTTITVTTEDCGKSSTCDVTVRSNVVAVTDVTLNMTELDLMEGEEATLTATVTPDNATNKTVTWESIESSIATVVNGKVTAVRPGKTTITVTTEDGGKSATCDVTVVPKSSDGNNESLDENVGEW